MNYWNTPARHTAECHVVERGSDGSHRLIHRPEPCPPAPGECLHIGAASTGDPFRLTCRACGTSIVASPLTLTTA